MPTYTNAYSGFSTSDIPATERFYRDTVGLDVREEYGMLTLSLPGGGRVLIYPKENHQPATYTCLNLEVANIEAAVDELAGRGISFERYDGMAHDGRGIVRESGPPIAWFTDPAGNIVSVIEESGS
jgi:catechol 2,3-dioxygenase-like lactoylglutathione lyase family enzyme